MTIFVKFFINSQGNPDRANSPKPFVEPFIIYHDQSGFPISSFLFPLLIFPWQSNAFPITY